MAGKYYTRFIDCRCDTTHVSLTVGVLSFLRFSSIAIELKHIPRCISTNIQHLLFYYVTDNSSPLMAKGKLWTGIILLGLPENSPWYLSFVYMMMSYVRVPVQTADCVV